MSGKQQMSEQFKKLRDLEPQPTVHGSGLKSVFKTNPEMPHNGTQVAFGHFRPGETCKSHVHPTMYEYFYFLSGEGTYRVGDEKYDLVPESFLEIPAGVEHSLHADKNSDLRFVYWGVATG